MSADGVRLHPGIGLERSGIGKQAGFTETLGELGLSTTGFIGFQAVNAAAVVDDQQFTVGIGAETNDP